MQILARRRVGAILLDLVMPEMDGFQFLAARAADPALRAIPAVIISAKDPAGQPIISPALAVARGGGISVGQLLACIEALTRILATAASPGHPEPAETSPS
jgi:CheY-like chemotaxis protein